MWLDIKTGLLSCHESLADVVGSQLDNAQVVVVYSLVDGYINTWLDFFLFLLQSLHRVFEVELGVCKITLAFVEAADVL